MSMVRAPFSANAAMTRTARASAWGDPCDDYDEDEQAAPVGMSETKVMTAHTCSRVGARDIVNKKARCRCSKQNCKIKCTEDEDDLRELLEVEIPRAECEGTEEDELVPSHRVGGSSEQAENEQSQQRMEIPFPEQDLADDEGSEIPPDVIAGGERVTQGVIAVFEVAEQGRLENHVDGEEREERDVEE